MGEPLRINGERGLRGVDAIDLLRDLPELRLKLRDEGRGGGGELDRLAVGGQARHTGSPGEELLAVIGVGLRPFHIHIATAQAMVEVVEDTDLQMAAVEHQRHLMSGFDEGLPADGGKSRAISAGSKVRVVC